MTGFTGWWLSGQSGHHPRPLPALGKPTLSELMEGMQSLPLGGAMAPTTELGAGG